MRKSHRLPRLLVRAAVLAACATALAPAVASARTVHYWVAAVPRPWNIAPNDQDAINHTPVDTLRSHISTTVYQRFSRNFGRRVSNESAGLAGPLIRAQVGDTIKVHFRNLDLENPHSMHFHGVRYAPGSDGVLHPGLLRARAATSSRATTSPTRCTPSRNSAGVWPYHDHSPSMMESIDGGMSGALSIRRRGERRPTTRTSSSSQSHERLHDDRRPRVRRQHARSSTRKRRRPRAVGRDHDRRRLPHLPRARAPLADRTARRATPQTVGPGGDLPRSAGARTRPGRGSTTATSRAT